MSHKADGKLSIWKAQIEVIRGASCIHRRRRAKVVTNSTPAVHLKQNRIKKRASVNNSKKFHCELEGRRMIEETERGGSKWRKRGRERARGRDSERRRRKEIERPAWAASRSTKDPTFLVVFFFFFLFFEPCLIHYLEDINITWERQVKKIVHHNQQTCRALRTDQRKIQVPGKE